MQLYELDETFKDREGKALTCLPGSKKSSLHAKTMVFDGATMFVGSFNFNQRALHINNEIGLVFHHPEIAAQAARNIEENFNKVAFKVEFSREGGRENMRWVGWAGRAGYRLRKGALRHHYPETDRWYTQVAADQRFTVVIRPRC